MSNSEAETQHGSPNEREKFLEKVRMESLRDDPKSSPFIKIFSELWLEAFHNIPPKERSDNAK